MLISHRIRHIPQEKKKRKNIIRSLEISVCPWLSFHCFPQFYNSNSQFPIPNSQFPIPNSNSNSNSNSSSKRYQICLGSRKIHLAIATDQLPVAYTKHGHHSQSPACEIRDCDGPFHYEAPRRGRGSLSLSLSLYIYIYIYAHPPQHPHPPNRNTNTLEIVWICRMGVCTIWEVNKG
ncbi:hypothetical protein HYC85_020575 [Camellia sinensis]|uniref:Uncharacterized protein n=1 Tax=Camellia sinensis TaxID=4442 RepID=A0A7J7GQ63_CAMSI|nr:hypothetical protein HYC85_020575 [Camellia sinensis]